jgi:non-specific serine/threonine protein kinase
LTNCILKLRKALGHGADTRIVTVPRVGYRLLGQVKRVAVGRRLLSRLSVKKGEAVPGRPHCLLDSQIGASPGIEVWLARHAKTAEARVFKFSLDGTRLASLKREATLYRVLRESLGNRHDIVHILGWNFETAPFFLECEYAGDNLDAWAFADGRLASLSTQDRLGLFLQIADTVAAAHAVGVLHKDLKPSNILMARTAGGPWQVRLADFGSGGLLDPERLDALGITRLDPNDAPTLALDSSSGTPLYVAPELLAGHLPSVQTDIFALGLMLYQIVSGDLRKPMVPGWERDIADTILVEDIAAATDGNPARRLGSVTELVNRLRSLESRCSDRKLAGLTQARLAAAERTAQRIRARRPWLVTAIATLAIGLVASLFLYRGQLVAQRNSQRERQRAEQINRFLTQDFLGILDPSAPGGLHDTTIKEALIRAAGRLGNRFNDDPATKGAIELAMGQAYSGLTDYDSAELHSRKAVELLRLARGPDDAATLDAQYKLAFALLSLNRLSDAATLLDDADRHAGARLGACPGNGRCGQG